MKVIIFIMVMAALLIFCKQTTPNRVKSVGIVEITTFKLYKGESLADFVKTAEGIQKNFLEKQVGFQKRILTLSEDSLWTDIVFWKDRQSAENALKIAETSEVLMPFLEKIDFASVQMNLTTPIIFEK